VLVFFFFLAKTRMVSIRNIAALVAILAQIDVTIAQGAAYAQCRYPASVFKMAED
jgi:hypothetical protein